MTLTTNTLHADPERVRRWLTTLHGGAVGILSVVSKDDWVGQYFSTDEAGINAAVNYVSHLDRRGREGIYTRCTTVRERPAKGRGLALHSLSFPGFWADIDIDGPGHEHEICPPDCSKTHRHITLPLPPDVEQAKRVVTESGLPEPTLIIHSGGGLYPWWFLTDPHQVGDDLADIATLSARWQFILEASAERLGYHYGRGVGDLARVLRIPGTINRKAGLARPCDIIEDTGVVYGLDDLAVASFSIDLPEPAPPQAGTPPSRPRPTTYTTGQVGPLTAFAEVCEPRDLLEPQGCYYVCSERDGAELWKYSGSSSSSKYSIRAWSHVLVNHSETTPLPVGAGHRLTPGKVFAYWYHGGTHAGALQAAAKDLIAAAAGSPNASPAARALRPAILDHIRDRCQVRPWSAPPTVNGSSPADPPFLHPADEPAESSEPENDGWEKGAGRRRGMLPEDFWAARPVFRHVRQAAHARARSGDIVFGGLLARLSSLLPPGLRADTGVGSPASLNIFSNLLGPSGSGKSSAAWIPCRLLPAPSNLDFLDELPLGTGEGIAEAYMGEKEVETGEIHRSGPKKGDPKTELIRAQVRHNVLFYADEGESLTKQLFGRNGTTVGETLRRAWTGGTIGQFNGHKVNTRVIESATYSLGIVVGFQPETALPLLEDAAAGTPQRFLWFSSTDPSIPEDVVEDPGPLNLTLIRDGFGAMPKVTFAASLLKQIRLDDRARSIGELRLPQLDSHKPLMLVKVASLLAILDDRLNVTEEDWQLAHVVWDTSCELRDWLLEYNARQQAEEAEKRTRAHVDRELRVHTAKTSVDRDVERVARRVGKRIHEASGMTHGALNKAIAHRDRGHLPAAVDLAESRGWIVVGADEITPGDSVPS